MNEIQHVFCIGAKSLGKYGGYETFIDKLTAYHQEDPRLQYHVACKANGDGCMDPNETSGARIIDDRNFIYHNAHCFRVPVPEKLGPAQAIYYDLAAFIECLRIIRRDKIPHPIVYIMTCRIGPFIGFLYRALHRLGGQVFLNPDGNEWKRAKWPAPVRKYWKYSERRMIKYCDLAVCDSMNIENYIHQSYDGKGRKGASPKTTFIAYGAETRPSALQDDDPRFLSWLREKELEPRGYYLIVGRFVPENNYETMIREYMSSNSPRKLAIITNVNPRFLDDLESRLHFRKDPRIRFVGTVYDQELLMKIRENAYAYFHGHEVGGTNPSLLEALGSTPLNLLLNVGFNSEVGQDAALYWTKDKGSLAALISTADDMPPEERAAYGRKAKARIQKAYSWPSIAARYSAIFRQP